MTVFHASTSAYIAGNADAAGAISIDAENGTLDLEVSPEELERRRATWKAPANMYQSGALRKFADQVGPARYGAVTHAGGKAEVHCYADI